MDEMTLIARYGEETPYPSSGRVDEARARLFERIDRRGIPGLSLGRAGALAGAAAIAVVAAVVVPSLGEEDSTGGATAQAAEALNAAAQVAEEQPYAPLTVGQYAYTKSETKYISSQTLTPVAVEPIEGEGTEPQAELRITMLVPKTREAWIGPDGSGRLAETVGEPEFLGERDRQAWVDAGSPDISWSGINETFGPGGLYFVDGSAYPTDVDQLRAALLEEHGETDRPENVTLFVAVGDLLRETVLSPELRAALYRLVASIEGVELLGEVTDPAGRPGVAVALTSDYSGAPVREEMIFDPDTSLLLAERSTLMGETDWVDAAPGTVIEYGVYLVSGVVNSTEEVPAAE